MKTNIFDFEVPDHRGSVVPLSHFKGKVLLVVNVASKCGFTPQYVELEELRQTFSHSSGFEILAFPCNQFGAQESGSDDEIQAFCSREYNVSFPVFGKTFVNGREEDPLFSFLKSQAPGLLGSKAIKWNFTKFLVAADGKTVSRFAPATKPGSLEGAIKKLLAAC